jgi:hypothetical protein
MQLANWHKEWQRLAPCLDVAKEINVGKHFSKALDAMR